jgi:hypothetical protein
VGRKDCPPYLAGYTLLNNIITGCPAMLYLIGLLMVLGLFFGPNLWVSYVLKKHHRHLPGMPGTGSELALHLLQQYKLEQVKVEKSDVHGETFLYKLTLQIN